MSLRQSFLMAVKNILQSKARSLLTMLGIIIGVAAVMVIVGMGNGMEGYITDSFQSMGTNLLQVMIMGRGSGSTRTVSADEMYELVMENPQHFSGLSPSVSLSNVKVGTESLSRTTAEGVGEDYLDMTGLEVAEGRFIQYVDNLKFLKVCVVGSYISEEFFNGAAIGQSVKIGGTAYEIVGVLTVEGDNDEGSSDDVIYVPYATAAKQSGTATIRSYSVAMVDENKVSEAKLVVENFLTKKFGNSDAYLVIAMSEILGTMSEMINVVVVILAAIAAISLLVGGIGIMNIMLVSVTERTREIGIRKALGAKRRHIMWQFVIEAGTTSAIGGVLGIGVGYALSSLATTIIVQVLDTNIVVAPSLIWVIGAFAISAGIGVLFGYLPARKAARLNPIDALRYD